MQLNRVLIVVEQRPAPDGSANDFDIRHMEGPLRSCGIADNIDVFYYGDYVPSCDEKLIEYCSEKKPQVVLLSLQNIWRQREPAGEPSPEAIGKIDDRLGIPSILFWFDVHLDAVARILEQYGRAAALSVILGADASSHMPLRLNENKYAYRGATFNENLFGKPDGVRDIPVGFYGLLSLNRGQWIEGLRRHGISPRLGGGQGTGDWMTYEKYVEVMSRTKIVLNFASLGNPIRQPAVRSGKEKVKKGTNRPLPGLKKTYRGFKYLLSEWKNPGLVSKYVISRLIKPYYAEYRPKYMVRGRVWEALWCRTFLLEESNRVTSKYFEPYADYVPFTTLSDLVDKIQYYLGNDGARDQIRLHGRATVEKYYNARNYWENLFGKIGIMS